MRLPTYFLSHGGGPWPFMDGPFRERYARLEDTLRGLPAELPETPRALLVVTAHWEAPAFRLSSHAQPPMLYDYSGFPPHTYEVQYPAPGDPALAAQVQRLLQAGGFAADLDPSRGLDHGTFSTLVPMYPAARMPVVQLSLQRGLDPATHLRAGQRLAPLRDEGVLILGSGLSYHNLSRFNRSAAADSQAFDAWLRDSMAAPPSQRWQRLLDWEQAPAARVAHPREEHLLPLMVAAGAAWEEAAQLHYHEEEFAGGLAVSGFRFG